MDSQAAESIQILRDSHDWVSCRDNLAVLAKRLKLVDVVCIISDQMKQFLLQILKTEPQIAGIAEAISSLTSVDELKDLQTISSNVWAVLASKASTPGMNNFRNTMKKIGRLETFERPSEEAVESFVDIISGIIMGSMDFIWGFHNQELWQRSFELKNRQDYSIRARHFMTDPQVIDIQQALWKRVADGIEAAIS